MAFIPTLFIAGLEKYSESGKDAHGNPVPSWSEVPEEHPVCGWSVPSSDEPKLAGHDRVVVDVELFAPTEFPAGPHDRVILNAEVFEVIGHAEDYTHGPWWDPGVVVWNLQRVEG
jgi:hypothetical protein